MPYFLVRIEHPASDRTLFTVEVTDSRPIDDMAVFDSTPAVICGVEADDQAAACAAAWAKGKRMLASQNAPMQQPGDDFYRTLVELMMPGLPGKQDQ